MIEEVVQAPRRPLKRPKLARKPIKRSSKTIQRKKKWKFVKSHLQECDDAFAREIKERDGKCLFPGCGTTQNLTCSHYIGRGNWNTRFDKQNCITICTHHHFFNRDVGYEFQKARKEKHGWDGQYTLHMKRLLGEEGFAELLVRAEDNKSRKEAIIEAQQRYGLRQERPNAPS